MRLQQAIASLHPPPRGACADTSESVAVEPLKNQLAAFFEISRVWRLADDSCQSNFKSGGARHGRRAACAWSEARIWCFNTR